MSPEIEKDQIETALPEFDIDQEIKEGNIKRVFDANYQEDRVALKIVPFDETEHRLEGYTEREIEAMRTLESDILVDFVDAWETDIEGTSCFIIVEEFVEGPTLKERIDVGPVGPRLGVKVTYPILKVLPKLDDHEIVHRDIKPENIKLGDDGVKLLDLGVARMNERETLTPDFRQSGPGTTAYSAPEVLRNDRESQNVRADLFSTGIVLYESITGEHPFSTPERNYRDSILEHNRNEMSVDSIDDEFEQKLNEFYKRLTEYEPAERYRKAEHASEDLEEIIERYM